MDTLKSVELFTSAHVLLISVVLLPPFLDATGVHNDSSYVLDLSDIDGLDYLDETGQENGVIFPSLNDTKAVLEDHNANIDNRGSQGTFSGSEHPTILPEPRGTDPQSFNITKAVLRGVLAQYDHCGHFCNGTGHVLYINVVSPVCGRCHCDDVCNIYGDCCPALENMGMLQDIPLSKYVCIELRNKDRPRYPVSVRIITDCPDNYSDDPRTETLCEECDPHSPSPVISPTTSIVYCNMYCSLCNGERQAVALERNVCGGEDDEGSGAISMETDLDLENTTMDQQSGDFIGTSEAKDCQELFIHPETYDLRECDLTESNVEKYITNCSVSGHVTNTTEYEDIVDLCNNYTLPVYHHGIRFKNLFCALCNDVVPGKLTVVRDREVFAGEWFRLGTLTNTMLHVVTSHRRRYEPNKWYDFAKGESRDVFCQSDRVWSGRQDDLFCDLNQKNTSLLDWYLLFVNFKLLANFSINFQLEPNSWEGVRNRIVSHLADVTQRLGPVIYAIGINGSFKNVFAIVQFLTNKTENRTDFEMTVISVFTNSSVVLELNEMSSIEYDMRIYEQGNEYLVLDNINTSYDNGSCCRTENTDDWEKRVSDNFPVDTYSKIEFDQTTPFATVKLNISEYTVDGEVVKVTYANVTLALSDVKSANDSLEVSLVYLLQAYRKAGLMMQNTSLELVSSEDEVESILSYICLTISIISLIFVLTTYSTFRQLRSLPGINNMFMASWLLVGQVLLLTVPFRTEIPDLCRVLGALLHYSWLAVVFWMSACSFHMFHVFVVLQSSLQAPHRNAWYIKRYVTLTHLLPLMIVVTVVIARWVQSDGQDIGYGGHVCYLNTPLLVGLGFILPLATCVTVNIVLLIVTTRALMHMKDTKIARATNVEPERQNIPVYVKLSSLTGLCWVVALLAEVPGCWWLKYVSTVLNGLQGLHLALSYTANKRVIRMWRKLFRESLRVPFESTDRSSQSQPTTQTTLVK